MYRKMIFVVLLMSLSTTSTMAKKKTLLGKAFEKVVLKGVDKALEDLDNGEQSKIINYYKEMKGKTKNNLEESNSVTENNNLKRVEYSLNGITLILKYPSKVKQGTKFIITAKMINDIKNANMGGLTLSFPQYSSLDGAIVSQKFDSVKGYAPPKKMYSSSLKKQIKIHYFVVEGWEHKWIKDTSRFMKVELTAPTDANELYINLRGVLIIGSKKSKYEITNPTNKNSLYTDQQGFYVKKINIKLTK